MLFNGIDGVIKLQADINHQNRQGGFGSFTALFPVLDGSWFHNDQSEIPKHPPASAERVHAHRREPQLQFRSVAMLISPRCWDSLFNRRVMCSVLPPV